MNEGPRRTPGASRTLFGRYPIAAQPATVG